MKLILTRNCSHLISNDARRIECKPSNFDEYSLKMMDLWLLYKGGDKEIIGTYPHKLAQEIRNELNEFLINDEEKYYHMPQNEVRRVMEMIRGGEIDYENVDDIESKVVRL